MTQQEIAKIVGTSQATISRIMGGEDRNTGYLLVDALRDLLESKEQKDRLQGS
jgi:transcriptional regulator with XRE-family HTH domain